MNLFKKEDENGIVFDNVTKFYNTKNGKNFILKDETFVIPENLNIGLLGRNGAGKSTLLRMMGGIDYPNSGEIRSNKSFSWPLALAGGFQGSLSGKDNCAFVARIHGKTNYQINKILEKVKEFSELGDYFYMPVNTYSSGMKSKLSFGLSVSFDFDYYLIDETLSVGDPSFKRKCEIEVNNIKENKNIILVSHDTKVIQRMCDVVILLDDKKLTLFTDVDEGIAKYENN